MSFSSLCSACPRTGLQLWARAQHLSMAIILVEGGWGKRNSEIENCEAKSCKWDRFSGMFKINITELRIAN